MSTLTDSYLAWDGLAHRPGCAKPSWTVDTRTEDGAFRTVIGGPSHACPNEECGHSQRYTKTSLRVVCSSCGLALIMSGDSDGLQRTSTKELGYGQPPKKAGALWLYPGAPLLFGWGHGEHEEPEGYLVTRTRVDRVTVDNVIGSIHKASGPRQGVQWSAAAVPDPKGEYGYGLVRWARACGELRSLTAAAKWIAAQAGETA
ncbi:hypothetical protein ACIQRW_28855 [Streptomyces sp. NPDC091287]|uniref:hypothetical protein n=1 Tax=Streptomyces sp. NPDC091287 TaxID=3365988 RepID=UPI0037F4F639